MNRITAILKGKRVAGEDSFQKQRAGDSRRIEAGPRVATRVNLEKLSRPEVFRDSFVILSRNFKLIMLAVAVSGLIHLMAGALLIGVPLMNPGNLPPVQVYSAFLAPMPSPSPPPAPPKGSPRGAGRTATLKAQPVVAPGVLVAPIDIPEEIPEEGVGSYGDRFGVPWGVEYEGEQPVFNKEFEQWINLPVEREEEPVRAIGEIKPPRLIRRVDPVYPEIARQIRKEGIVILEATTDVFGHVQSVRVLRSEPFLDEAAIEAVRQWV